MACGTSAVRTRLMLLDRDPAAWAPASRPVEPVWRGNGSRLVGHAPQLMARLKKGGGLPAHCVGPGGPSTRLAEQARIVAAAAGAAG